MRMPGLGSLTIFQPINRPKKTRDEVLRKSLETKGSVRQVESIGIPKKKWDKFLRKNFETRGDR